jgi:uncharacterized protein YjbJ (UPF0337 family)
MENDVIADQWRRLNGVLRRRWGRLTEEDLAPSEGNSAYLASLIEQRYGMISEVAERQVRDFGRRIERRLQVASQALRSQPSPGQGRSN